MKKFLNGHGKDFSAFDQPDQRKKLLSGYFPYLNLSFVARSLVPFHNLLKVDSITLDTITVLSYSDSKWIRPL